MCIFFPKVEKSKVLDLKIRCLEGTGTIVHFKISTLCFSNGLCKWEENVFVAVVDSMAA